MDFLNKINWVRVAIFVLAFVFTFCLGYYFANKNNRIIEHTKIVYKYKDPISDTVYIKKIYHEIQPVDTLDIITQCVKDKKFEELFPEKIRDSIIVITKNDTTKIMRDWATQRIYHSQLFNVDTIRNI